MRKAQTKTDIRYVDSYVRAEPDLLVSALNCMITLILRRAGNSQLDMICKYFVDIYRQSI